MSSENIEILDELNYLVSLKDSESKFQFTYSEAPGRFFFYVEEFETTGQSFLVFDSEEPIPEDIEKMYEEGNITFKQMVHLVIIEKLCVYLGLIHEISLIMDKE